MRQKLKNSRGETLVEVLVSTLICALSVALLFSAVLASRHMDETAQETDAKYYQALTKAERQLKDSEDRFSPASAVTVTVALKDPGAAATAKDDFISDTDVTFYGTNQLLSYAKKTGGGS